MVKNLSKHLLKSIIKIILEIQKIRRTLLHKIKNDCNSQKIKNILIYLSMGIGDIILFTPTLKIIKETFPHAQIALMTNMQSSYINIFQGSGLIDEIIYFSRKSNILKKIRFIKKMRDKHFDLLINGFWTDDIYLALICVLCNIPCRAGYCSNDKWHGSYDFIYNIKVEMGENEHEIDRGLRLAYALGAFEPSIEKKPAIFLEEKDELFAKEFFIENRLEKNDLIIGIQPGTATHQKWKRWALEKYSELSSRLIKSHKAKIVIFGSRDELTLAENLKGMTKYEVVDSIGKTTIKEAAALIKRCNLFICNDSGLMHISAAVDTPVIAIYGPTDYRRTAPFGDIHTIIRKNISCSPCFKPSKSEVAENCPYDYKCLDSVSVDEVFDVVSKKIRQLKM
ncbi:MAG: lipopolysaccharide heptosyltransferase II [Candidatus Hodarchaeota archaeon]